MIQLSQNFTAIGPGLTSSFAIASGGGGAVLDEIQQFTAIGGDGTGNIDSGSFTLDFGGGKVTAHIDGATFNNLQSAVAAIFPGAQAQFSPGGFQIDYGPSAGAVQAPNIHYYSLVGPGGSGNITFGNSEVQSFQNSIPSYTWSVLPGGAGGSVDQNGLYTAPLLVPSTAALQSDVVQVQDQFGNSGQSSVMVGNPLLLTCEIIQNQLGLANGRVYLWNQKIIEPSDNGLYVAVSVMNAKPFGNINRLDYSGTGINSVQSLNVAATLSIDIISRGMDALLRKEEILLALASNYAQTQQEANAFYISKLPPGAQFTNLSAVDGAAIPYRFNISVVLQYTVTKTTAVGYYSSFQKTPQLVINP